MKQVFQLFTTVLAIVVLAGGAAWAKPKKAETGETVTVYKSPTCGCCGKWEEHLKAAGFKVVSKPTEDMNSFKDKNGVPSKLRSCHTGVVGGYVVEGHVPASTIKNLLAKKPKGVKGIAVPGMPEGSPGMEGPNPEKYEVMTFGDKEEVFEKF